MKSVSLKDAMDQSVRKPDDIFLNGAITPEPGDASLVRLYPNPLSSSKFYLISAQDVSAVHQWDPEELLHAGVVGHTLHRITLGAYAKIKQVTVTLLEARHLVRRGPLKPKDSPCADGYDVCPCPASSTCCSFLEGCVCDDNGDATCVTIPPPRGK